MVLALVQMCIRDSVIIILLAIIVLAILFPAGIKSAAPWVIVALMLISALLLWIGISAGISGGGF